jgi:hypothetical protein
MARAIRRSRGSRARHCRHAKPSAARKIYFGTGREHASEHFSAGAAAHFPLRTLMR